MDADGNERYPSIELAYEWVFPSYESLQNRLDAVDRRIEGIPTFSVAAVIPLLVVTVSKPSEALDLSGWWFVLAVASFIGEISLGFYGRQTG